MNATNNTREHPIIFSGESVRAILDGRKTQTRRVIKPQPPDDCGAVYVGVYAPTVIDRDGNEQPGPEVFGAYSGDGSWALRCPYGTVGDRLWVRETWCQVDDMNGDAQVHYAADREDIPPPWRSPIHMPRWASRILLEITDLRVQRVQDISEADAFYEGVERLNLSPTLIDFGAGLVQVHPLTSSYVDAFKTLWDTINAKRGYGWDANPWVWAITFKRAEGE
jgi:hypothetical protein